MNIVITLPVNLIAEILEGRKLFEIRSQIPANFNIKRDVVYVVQKGTQKVVLYFTIAKFITNLNLKQNAQYIAENAAVPIGWLKTYAQSKDKIHAWVIGCCCKVTNNTGIYPQLGIKSNPQAYMYTACEWRQLGISYFRWNSEYNDKQLDPNNEREQWLQKV